jgi:hypothetical protein
MATIRDHYYRQFSTAELERKSERWTIRDHVEYQLSRQERGQRYLELMADKDALNLEKTPPKRPISHTNCRFKSLKP